MFSRKFKNILAYKAFGLLTIFFVSIVVLFVLILFLKSLPILEHQNFFSLISSSDWFPLKKQFGLLPFIISTIAITILSIIIATPLCLLTAIYFTEYIKRKYLKWFLPFIDILAGLPSVIYGVWGILIVVPFIKDYIAPFFGIETSGYNLLSGGIVLGIMIIPVMTNVMIEVLQTVPSELRDASLSLGATQWQTTKFVTLRKVKSGLIASIVLGLSRAFGETIAVLMVVGNVAQIPTSLFDSVYPIPALIANNYGEMMSIPLYDSALMFSAFILLLIVIVFNIGSRYYLRKLEMQNQSNLD